jgi:uncharacterized membrane protein YvlD (DUF360 family)
MFAKLVVKAILYAIALVWLIPALGIGVHINGDFGTAVGIAVAFAAVSWLVNVVIGLVVDLTLGLAGCLMIFVWWLVPALCVHFTAQLFPQSMSVAGFWAAVWGGLVLMVASMIANSLTSKKSSN